jgi:hypothetical protein
VKAAPFDYARPSSLELAVELLSSGQRTVKILAGGQSLGPMLNLPELWEEGASRTPTHRPTGSRVCPLLTRRR